MARTEATNQFDDGLIMDLNPLNTPANVLTDCLNGTIITYNGNEFMLQNDMGNYKLENCRLKENFVPVGIKEYAGILYIVSYNPLTKETEIGSYPSPQRVSSTNSRDKSNGWELVPLIGSAFTNDDYENIIKNAKLVIYTDQNINNWKLNPGDEYKLLVDLTENSEDPELVYPYQWLKFSIMDETRKITELNDGEIEYITEDGDVFGGAEYSKIKWETPGWLCGQYILANFDKHILSIRNNFQLPNFSDNGKVAINNLPLTSQLLITDELLGIGREINGVKLDVLSDIRLQFTLKINNADGYLKKHLGVYETKKLQSSNINDTNDIYFSNFDTNNINNFTQIPFETIDKNGNPISGDYNDITNIVNGITQINLDNLLSTDIIIIEALPLINYNNKIVYYKQFAETLEINLSTIKNNSDIVIANQVYQWFIDNNSLTLFYNISGPFTPGEYSSVCDFYSTRITNLDGSPKLMKSSPMINVSAFNSTNTIDIEWDENYKFKDQDGNLPSEDSSKWVEANEIYDNQFIPEDIYLLNIRLFDGIIKINDDNTWNIDGAKEIKNQYKVIVASSVFNTLQSSGIIFDQITPNVWINEFLKIQKDSKFEITQSSDSLTSYGSVNLHTGKITINNDWSITANNELNTGYNWAIEEDGDYAINLKYNGSGEFKVNNANYSKLMKYPLWKNSINFNDDKLLNATLNSNYNFNFNGTISEKLTHDYDALENEIDRYFYDELDVIYPFRKNMKELHALNVYVLDVRNGIHDRELSDPWMSWGVHRTKLFRSSIISGYYAGVMGYFDNRDPNVEWTTFVKFNDDVGNRVTNTSQFVYQNDASNPIQKYILKDINENGLCNMFLLGVRSRYYLDENSVGRESGIMSTQWIVNNDGKSYPGQIIYFLCITKRNNFGLNGIAAIPIKNDYFGDIQYDWTERGNYKSFGQVLGMVGGVNNMTGLADTAFLSSGKWSDILDDIIYNSVYVNSANKKLKYFPLLEVSNGNITSKVADVDYTIKSLMFNGMEDLTKSILKNFTNEGEVEVIESSDCISLFTGLSIRLPINIQLNGDDYVSKLNNSLIPINTYIDSLKSSYASDLIYLDWPDKTSVFNIKAKGAYYDFYKSIVYSSQEETLDLIGEWWPSLGVVNDDMPMYQMPNGAIAAGASFNNKHVGGGMSFAWSEGPAISDQNFTYDNFNTVIKW